jgi:hypothetical protein
MRIRADERGLSDFSRSPGSTGYTAPLGGGGFGGRGGGHALINDQVGAGFPHPV